MRYLRPISRRLLPDDMLVLPSNGQGGYGDARMVRHARLELADGDDRSGSRPRPGTRGSLETKGARGRPRPRALAGAG